MKRKPAYIRESERFLADCGYTWTNALDLMAIADKNPDIEDICWDIIRWIVD